MSTFEKPTGNIFSSNKRRVAPDVRGTLNGFKSDWGKLLLVWDPQISILQTFKASKINIIFYKEENNLGSLAQELEDLGQIIWNAGIPHGGGFSANQKERLENSEQYHKFLADWGSSSWPKKV
ncbi:uncharacterized protein VP01_243g5 [Puccinia sorghi]|uniref:Uncharacterized protein n=1 Tax=Puccinia sorghi TaxID=27349 RepID=A0A0L6V839_9BASI|nr:uncharacterized protein VP01_243g5 [Puccinia sorghi]